MGSFLSSLELIYDHWRMAMIQGGVFFIGIFSAGIVLKYRLSFLMRFPLWMIDRIMRILAADTHPILMFLLIAAFNSIAIMIYMSTGALFRALPTAICFLTGMNIGIVAGAMPYVMISSQREKARQLPHEPPAPPVESKATFIIRSIGGIMVVTLELPSLWFSIAMGTTIEMTIFNPAFSPETLANRVLAYITIIVPILVISAAIETLVIRMSMSSEPPKWKGDGD